MQSHMENCFMSCKDAAEKTSVVKGFMDTLLRRPLDEKMDNHCHIHCIKSLGQNFKRNDRWGFVPILGTTEFFSSFLAMLNLGIHIYSHNRRLARVLKRSRLWGIVKTQYCACNVTMLASIIFHMRDTAFLRYFDYFSAYLSIMVGVVSAVSRVLLYFNVGNIRKGTWPVLALGLLYFIFHVHKMAFVHFDKAYNRLTCGFMFFIIFVCDFFLLLTAKGRSYGPHITRYLGALVLAGLSEMLDVSPVFLLFDSHALWHLFFVVSTPYYMEFVADFILSIEQIKDAKFNE
ncbi:post-GPI attachment to proteins factor 3 [Enteropsectra breve]|nr:post-GPI attachment to proteins factor 3 [Enteropsectra breve]